MRSQARQIEIAKRCFKCGETKLISEFYRHSAMADGHLNKCKSCTRSDVSASYRADPLGRRAYEQERQRRPDRRQSALAYQANRRLRHPEKARARAAVSNALRDGRLVRQPCKVCGATKVQAHHHDYGRPLDVEWLCFRCHRNERHGQNVLPDTEPEGSMRLHLYGAG